MELENELDVTILEPRDKHPTIFSRFNELSNGESFVIYNDHDPKPLYFQMQAEIPNAFEWEYLEDGPQVFRVKITRTGSGSIGFGGSCCS